MAIEDSVSHVVDLESVIGTLVRSIEVRDPYTAGHQYRVAALCQEIARQFGFEEDRIKLLYYGALIHDFGKIYVPLDILNRPGRLTAPELDLIRSHSQIGYNIVAPMNLPEPINELILHHHERLDGEGYPQGLRGDRIGIECRILQLADVVEAMSSHRPYRAALGVEQALEEIEEWSGKAYDAEVVGVCVDLFRRQGFRFPILHPDRHPLHA